MPTQPFGRLVTLFLLAMAFAAPAAAGPAGDVVASCLADNTNGKDRKDLTRWVFIAMAAHPSIKELGNVSTTAADESARKVGALLSRLITESCSKEIRAMVQAEGTESLRTAFEFLGKVAFQELTANQDVNKSLQQFQQYVDRTKLESALAPR